MKSRGISVLAVMAICAMAGGWAVIQAQQPAAAAKDPNAEADDKILTEVHDHNEIMSNLEYVSDMIGARLTGSENLKQANDWTRQKFADYGVANPHLESWTIAHTWGRGAASGRIISPSLHPLAIASYAWAPSTNGAVRGPVVYVKAQSVDDLTQYKGKLKGAIVISAEPALLPPPDQPAPNPVTIPYGDSMVLVAPHRPGAQPTPGPGYREFIRARTEFFKNQGVLATLTDSGKPDGLLNMTGLGGRNYDIAPIPAAFVSSASYRMIWRLLQRGPVEVELNLTNSIGDKPVEVTTRSRKFAAARNPTKSCCSAHIWIPGILAR